MLIKCIYLEMINYILLLLFATAATTSAEFLPNGCPANFGGHLLLPHETDCSLFYSCSNGRKIQMSCPSGLHFDPVIQVCNWPKAVNCVPGGTTTTQKMTTTTPSTTSSASVTTSATPSTTEAVQNIPGGTLPNGCPADFQIQLLLPHGTDCSVFYSCSNGNKIPMNCPPGLHFDPVQQNCDWPQNVNCIPGGTTTTQATTTTTTTVASTTSSTTSATPSTTPSTTAPDQEFLPNGCPSDFGVHHLLPHEYDCTKFYSCSNGNKIPMRCAHYTYFDFKQQRCDWPHLVHCTQPSSTVPTPPSTNQTKPTDGTTTVKVTTTTEVVTLTPTTTEKTVTNATSTTVQEISTDGVSTDEPTTTEDIITEKETTIATNTEEPTTIEDIIVTQNSSTTQDLSTTEGIVTNGSSTTEIETDGSSTIEYSSTDGTTSTPRPDTTTTISEEETTTTVNVTTTTNGPTTDSLVPICPPGFFGHFPHPELCDAFFMCSGGVAIKLTCISGFEFDPELSQCVPISDTGCFANQATSPGQSTEASSPEYETTTTTDPDGLVTKTTDQVVTTSTTDEETTKLTTLEEGQTTTVSEISTTDASTDGESTNNDSDGDNEESEQSSTTSDYTIGTTSADVESTTENGNNLPSTILTTTGGNEESTNENDEVSSIGTTSADVESSTSNDNENGNDFPSTVLTTTGVDEESTNDDGVSTEGTTSSDIDLSTSNDNGNDGGSSTASITTSVDEESTSNNDNERPSTTTIPTSTINGESTDNGDNNENTPEITTSVDKDLTTIEGDNIVDTSTLSTTVSINTQSPDEENDGISTNDPSTQSTTSSSTDSTPSIICPPGVFGNFPHPYLCDVFYMCMGGQPMQLSCADGLEFDPAKERCVPIAPGGCTLGPIVSTTPDESTTFKYSTTEQFEDKETHLTTEKETSTESPNTDEPLKTTLETELSTKEPTQTTSESLTTTLEPVQTTSGSTRPPFVTTPENLIISEEPETSITTNQPITIGVNEGSTTENNGVSTDGTTKADVELSTSENGGGSSTSSITTSPDEESTNNNENEKTSTTIPTSTINGSSTENGDNNNDNDVSSTEGTVTADTSPVETTTPSTSIICPPGVFGNFPHPYQCDVFYMCMGGSAMLLSCADGLEFDPEKARCIPIAPGGCTLGPIVPTTTDENTTVKETSTESISTTDKPIKTTLESEVTTDKPTQTTSESIITTDPPTSTKVDEATKENDESSSTSTEGSVTVDTSAVETTTPSICPPGAFGNFPHPYLCDVFYMCMGGPPLLLPCADGLEFDPTLASCVPIAPGGCTLGPIVPESIAGESTTTNPQFEATTGQPLETNSENSEADICPPGLVANVPNQDRCDGFYMCTGGKAIPLLCNDGFEFDANAGTCVVIAPGGCTLGPITSINTDAVEIKNSSLEINLVDIKEIPEEITAPEETTTPEICPSGGIINVPHPERCDAFYMCIGGPPLELHCTAGYEFDVTTRKCVLMSEDGCTVSKS